MYTLIILEYCVKKISIFLDVKYGILLSPKAILIIYKSKTNKSGIKKSRILLIDARRLLKSLSCDK